jgi:chloramphenicol 3-O-phosphotransferase
MHLVYLYGPPGVGKLTIGRALADLTGFKLFHNHLIVDLATSLFPREMPEYFDFIRVVRGAGFEAAARTGVSLIATGVYRNTEAYRTAMARMIAPVLAYGGKPLFVQLTCEREEWLRRVQSPDRDRQKITDVQTLFELMERVDLFSAMPFEPHLAIDTSGRQPAEVARKIAGHLAGDE